LRITILAVPPVLPSIHRDLVLSESAVGALTGLPILILSLAAIAGSALIARIGARRAWIAGLLLIAICGAARGAGPSTLMLFGMTVLMGIGVAVCQPAAPTVVGEWFPRQIGFATAIYVNGLLVGETLSAALTIPYILPLLHGSWEWSFVFWSLPVFLAVLLLAAFTRETPARAGPAAEWWPNWRDGFMWRLGIIQGGASIAYWGANAFIPDYLHAVARPELIGPSLAVINFGQLPASFATLFLAQRLAGKREVFMYLGLLALAGLAVFILAPGWLGVLAIGFVGAATSFTMVMVLALLPMVAEQRDVHHLTAGVLTISYGGTFIGNFLSGVLWDATHAPLAAFVPLGLGAVVLTLGAVGMRKVSPA
jgi:CP family cyanate transporter-like MFS transporter